MEDQMTPQSDAQRVPLFFTFRDTVFGNGFLADVCAEYGRALGVKEEDGFWMYGINPGGMAANGNSPAEVLEAFRRTFSNVLVDIARDAASFEDFRTAVTEFFNDTNEGYIEEWLVAAQGVRECVVVGGCWCAPPVPD